MKVIDLVKQIALKKIPKRIKYNDYEWEYDGENYKIQASSDTYMNWDYIIFNCLNEEVEIIEEHKEETQEHKIPEKFELHSWGDKNEYGAYVNSPFPTEEEFMNKINEIIDYLEVNNDGKR